MDPKKEPTKISATELQRLSGQIIRRTYFGEHFIVERDGLPVVAIVPVSDYATAFDMPQIERNRLNSF